MHTVKSDFKYTLACVSRAQMGVLHEKIAVENLVTLPLWVNNYVCLETKQTKRQTTNSQINSEAVMTNI